MIYRNDYIRLTKEYLRNLTYYKMAVRNIQQDVADMQERVKSISPKITSYSQASGGGTPELNGVEAGAETLMCLEEKIEAYSYEILKLQHHVEKLERCIDSLPQDEQDVIRRYYVDKLKYDEIVDICHVSYSTCRRRISKGTRTIAIMLFGARADQKIQFAF